MPEPLVAGAAIVPGLLTVLAVFALGRRQVPLSAIVGPALDRAAEAVAREKEWKARGRLARAITRAGWSETPERVAVLTVAVSAGLVAIGMATSLVVAREVATSLAAAGSLAGVVGVGFALQSAARSRRRLLLRELAPLLELFVLELGGGGSALSALGSVTMQIDGELAAEIRRLLIASQVSGSASFESRLRAYAEMHQLAPLNSLATILVASREYGTGVTQGVRALAADLRRSQRRELIAHSRRALNHVLFPAAIGVLLPFLAILLYPAVTSLQANLR